MLKNVLGPGSACLVSLLQDIDVELVSPVGDKAAQELVEVVAPVR
jgi:hypothetical protein